MASCPIPSTQPATRKWRNVSRTLLAGSQDSSAEDQIDADGDHSRRERRGHCHLWRHDGFVARPAHDHVSSTEEHGGYESEDDADAFEVGGPTTIPGDRGSTGHDQDGAERECGSERLPDECDGQHGGDERSNGDDDRRARCTGRAYGMDVQELAQAGCECSDDDKRPEFAQSDLVERRSENDGCCDRDDRADHGDDECCDLGIRHFAKSHP